jgi:hypothetical protein
MGLNLSLFEANYAVCRLGPEAAVPVWARAGAFTSITRTTDELSVICAAGNVPEEVKSDRGWRCFKVEGPLDLSLTGVLSSLLSPLAEAKVNILAVSTYETDYLLVKDEKLGRAIEVLRGAGHRLTEA